MSSGRQMLPADHQGSIVSMADAGGALAGINSYDEWGVPDVGNSGRFQYTGQAWIPELGMYHYKARVYSPTLDRKSVVSGKGVSGGVDRGGRGIINKKTAITHK